MLSINEISVKKALDGYAQAYKNEELISDFVSPIVTVEKDTFCYYEFNNEERRITNTHMVAGAPAPVFDWKPSNTSTATVLWKGARSFISDDALQNEDAVVELLKTTVDKLSYNVLLQEEIYIAGQLQATANFTSLDQTATAKWDVSTCDIEADVMNAVETLKGKGITPNTIIIPSQVKAKALPLLKSTVGGLTLRDKTGLYQLPDPLFGLKVYEPRAVKITTDEGLTPTYGNVWGSHVTICYVSPTKPSKRDCSVSWTFRSKPLTVQVIEDKLVHGQWVEVTMKQLPVVVSKNSAYVFRDCLT